MRDDPRIGLFLDYENLAIGARDHLGRNFDFAPVAAAMAERGRVLVRRAYADWSYFAEDRKMLARSQVELIEIPQRLGGSRKNAADIKLAVDVVELAFEREYLDTFVICTGDSDLTPLVHKLRELDRTVIGLGVENSTSKLLPPACDEFIFYDRLVQVDDDGDGNEVDLDTLVVQAIAGLKSTDESIRASTLKRVLLRRDPTFSERDHGFRSFGELLRHLAGRGVVELTGSGDPEVDLAGADDSAFTLLADVVRTRKRTPVMMSGLKTAMLKRDPGFDERRLGYRSFGDFCRAAENQGFVVITREDGGDQVVSVPPA